MSASPGLSAVFGPHGVGGYYGSSGYGGNAPVITAVDYSVSIPSQIQSGTLTAVKLTALGTNGRTATAYTGTANLTSSDSGATFYASSTSTTPITSIAFVNGTATVYVKFANAGRQTVTATDGTISSIAGSAGTLVTTPDVVTQYFMVLNPTVVSGSPMTVKIYAEDANGFVVKNYATPSDFTLTSTDTKAVLPSSVKFVNGVATVQVTFETGNATGMTESLTAADRANKLTQTVSTSVVTDAASDYAINLPPVVRAGQPVSVQVYTVDATGHIVKGYSGSAKVTITGSSTTSENVSFTNGVATFSVTFASAAAGTQGTVTVADQAAANPLPTAEAFTAVISSSRLGWRRRRRFWRLGRKRFRRERWKWFERVRRQRFRQHRHRSAQRVHQHELVGLCCPIEVSGAVTAVAGSWTVPTVTGSGTGYSAIWVGIDGYQSSTVEQIGTEQDAGGDYAWYEMYPAASQTISSLAASAGDNITASVAYSNGTFTLTIKDTTTGNRSPPNGPGANLQRSSAEWIVEAPSSGGVLPLANFGTATFTSARQRSMARPARSTIRPGQSPSTWQAAAARGSHDLGPDLTGDGFSVSYDSSGGSSGIGGFGFGVLVVWVSALMRRAVIARTAARPRLPHNWPRENYCLHRSSTFSTCKESLNGITTRSEWHVPELAKGMASQNTTPFASGRGVPPRRHLEDLNETLIQCGKTPRFEGEACVALTDCPRTSVSTTRPQGESCFFLK